MCIEGNSFDAINKFRYLGNTIDNEGHINTTIHDKIQIGNKAYYANSSLLRSKLVSCNTKIKIDKSLIRPVITYGGKAWTLTKKEKEKPMYL